MLNTAIDANISEKEAVHLARNLHPVMITVKMSWALRPLFIPWMTENANWYTKTECPMELCFPTTRRPLQQPLVGISESILIAISITAY